MQSKYPEEVTKFLAEQAAKARAKRWANHEKQTPEEKKKKRAEYMKEYRKRKKQGK